MRQTLSFDELRDASPEKLSAAFNGPDAALWLEAAARYGMVEAQLLYGQLLLDGRGVQPDPRSALGWFRAAAQSGDAMGRNMLGRCFENGWGTPPDMDQAAACYRAAAEQGLDWAQYNTGNMYLRGAGVPKDLDIALDWYRRAAAQGHAKAINLVGRFLEEGWVGPVDLQAAAQCYHRAAEGGDFRGQFNLGTLLANQGETGEALGWFRRALETGTPGFKASMAARLGEREEPVFRALAAEILVLTA